MVKYKITINYDECADNPLYWQHKIKFACEHGRYNLGNCALNDLLTDYDYDGDFYNISDIVEYMSNYGYVVPLSMTDHSGLSFNLGISHGWDTGIIGIVFIDNSDLGNVSIDVWNDEINMYLEEYEHYLNGEIYSFIVEKYTSNGMELIDSVGGYLDYESCKLDSLECVPIEYRDNIEWVD